MWSIFQWLVMFQPLIEDVFQFSNRRMVFRFKHDPKTKQGFCYYVSSTSGRYPNDLQVDIILFSGAIYLLCIDDLSIQLKDGELFKLYRQ